MRKREYENKTLLMKIKFVSAIYFIGLNREIMSVKTKGIGPVCPFIILF